MVNRLSALCVGKLVQRLAAPRKDVPSHTTLVVQRIQPGDSMKKAKTLNVTNTVHQFGRRERSRWDTGC